MSQAYSGKKESKSPPTRLARGFQAIVVTIPKITLDHDEVRFDGNWNANCCSRPGGRRLGKSHQCHP